jgi:hypothetical protein
MPFIGKQPEVGAYSKLDAITTSATATYNLTLDSGAYYPTSANHLLVSLNGVMQAPQDSFTVSGSTIVFASTLASTDSIDFIMALGDVLDIGTPSDGTVSTAKIQDDAITSAKIAGALTTTGTTGIGIGQEPHSTAALGITTTNQHIRMTNGSELGVVSLQSDGNIELWAHGADATQFRSGSGVGAIAARIDADGLKFGTDTAAANALDDYEEGTWTPAFVSVNSTTPTGTFGHVGSYTKIGRAVNVIVYMQVTSGLANGGGILAISGIPFTALIGDGYHSTGAITASTWNSERQAHSAATVYDATRLGILTSNDNGVWAWEQTGSLNNSCYMRFSLTYYTAA